jgi:A/G-specific adenine glycosylase
MNERFYLLYRRKGITPTIIRTFQSIIYEYYRENGRTFPWRQTTNPYHILVSEIMLQQTQTSRVLKKYDEFITAFPDFESLVAAPLQQVLRVWQGIGYNRRALALREAARIILSSFNGRLPSSPDMLITLPGIGPYTASAIPVFAFNQPHAFIETNIRTVYLHFFFSERNEVNDKEILPIIEATLDRANPREWYYALFDYGAFLKSVENLDKKSAHYRKQSAFKGSDREIRGQIIKFLLSDSTTTEKEIVRQLKQDTKRVKRNLDRLQKEGFLTISDGDVRIK